MLNKIFRYGLLRRLRRGGRIYFWVTLRCSLNCSYCTNKICDPDTVRYNEISLSEWKKLIDELQFRRDLPVQEIFITGGEALIYKGCDDLINYILENSNAMVTIFTNLVNDVWKQPIKNSLRLRFVASYHLNMSARDQEIWQRNYAWMKQHGYNLVVEKFSSDIDIGKIKPLLDTDSMIEMNECYCRHRDIFAPDGTYKRNVYEMLSGEYTDSL